MPHKADPTHGLTANHYVYAHLAGLTYTRQHTCTLVLASSRRSRRHLRRHETACCDFRRPDDSINAPKIKQHNGTKIVLLLADITGLIRWLTQLVHSRTSFGCHTKAFKVFLVFFQKPPHRQLTFSFCIKTQIPLIFDQCVIMFHCLYSCIYEILHASETFLISLSIRRSRKIDYARCRKTKH